ncbi:MAG: TIGR03086 family metal-binding protein [Actinomycetota bacterium]|nr:TIGR03086 family metal-binding protein [Actinomycetota bacterium]
MMIDLRPAADRMAGVATSVEPQDLAGASPCPDMSVGDLLDHVLMLTEVFTGVAQKYPGVAPPGSPSAANLPGEWREELRRRLGALVEAWSDPSAWDGIASVAGSDLPATVAGMVVLDELVVHGWDIATATGQPYDVTGSEIEAAAQFVSSFPAPRNGSLFGPVVEVDDGAPPLDRLLGQTGRDPAWRPPAS